MDDQINNNNHSELHRFSWCDACIILILSIAISISFPVLKSLSPGKVTVYKDNQIIAEYPIDRDIIFDVQGKDGLMKVEILKQSVNVLSSSCPHQLCVHQRSISNALEQIVCIPNHILITISAKKDNQLDAIAH